MTKKDSDVKLDLGEEEEEEGEEEGEDEEGEEEEDEAVDLAPVTKQDEKPAKTDAEPEAKQEPKKQEEQQAKKPTQQFKPKPLADPKKKKPDITNFMGGDQKKYEGKSIFTKVSESLFSKQLDDTNKKTSVYDMLMNDTFLDRVKQKSDRSNNQKFQDFQARNKELVSKKEERLKKKAEKYRKEIEDQMYAVPDNKVLDKVDMRNLEDFLKDREKYYHGVEMNNKKKQQDAEEKMKKDCPGKPSISEKTRELAKLRGEENLPVQEKLYKENMRKPKKHENTKVKKPKEKQQRKLNPEEIKDLSAKLHEDAKKRAEEKKKQQEEFQKNEAMRNRIKAKLSSDQSNIIMLNKFLAVWNEGIKGLKQTDGENQVEEEKPMKEQMTTESLSKDDLVKLLHSVGMLKFDHFEKPEENHAEKDAEELEQEKKEAQHKKSEFELIRKFAYFLSKGELPKDGKDSTEGEPSDEDFQDINSWKAFVSCAAILGIYKGEINDNQKENPKEGDEKSLGYNPKTKSEANFLKRNHPATSLKEDEDQAKRLSTTPYLEKVIKSADIVDSNKLTERQAKRLHVTFMGFFTTYMDNFAESKRREIEEELESHQSKPSMRTEKQAMEFRKRCLESIQDELEKTLGIDSSVLNEEKCNLSYMNKTSSRVRLEDVYLIMKKRREK